MVAYIGNRKCFYGWNVEQFNDVVYATIKILSSAKLTYALYEFLSLNDYGKGGKYTIEKLASQLAKIRRENPAYQSEEALLGLIQQTFDAGKSYFRGRIRWQY